MTADTTVCGVKVKFTVHTNPEKTISYSTVGGLIVVNGELFALTTAHAFMIMVLQSSGEAQSADPQARDDSVAGYETGAETVSQLETEFGMGDNLGEESDLEQQERSSLTDVPGHDSEYSNMRWLGSYRPEVFAYLGSGTVSNSFSAAPDTSDFALLHNYSPYGKTLNRYRDAVQGRWVDITGHILTSDLRAARVHIIANGDGVPLTGYLLDGDSSLILRGVVMRTKMIQIPFTARQGISGAWVVCDGQLLGAVYAAYSQSPYLHTTPGETIFKDIENFPQVSGVRVATAADLLPPVDRGPVTQHHPGETTVQSSLQPGSALSTVSDRNPLAQVQLTSELLLRPQRRLVVFCDGSWLGRETRIRGAPRSNIQMLADVVGQIEYSGLDGNENPVMVHRIIPHRSDVIAGYQEGFGSQQNFLDLAWDSTIGERLSDECFAVYRFIVEHYTDDYSILLFGHSRGAYTARSVAGMINNCGIMRRNREALSTEQVDRLCYEVYRIYRSSLPIDSPSSGVMERFRRNADKIWQVEQPILFMGLIDSVGPRGLPRIPGAFEPTSFEFFDQRVSSTVKHVYHAVAVHERLSVIPQCLVHASKKSPSTVVHQTWLPGTHYDLGRTIFRFIPQTPFNNVAHMLGLLSSLLSRTIWPNEVLADCALKWLLEGVRDVDPGSATQTVIPNIEEKIAALDLRMATPSLSSTGSGDMYGDLCAMESPSRTFVDAVRTVLMRLLLSSWGTNNLYSRDTERTIQVLTPVTDRRMVIGSDTYPYQSQKMDRSKGEFTIEENARMKDWNEWHRPRYPSRTFETFELWNEVFGDSSY